MIHILLYHFLIKIGMWSGPALWCVGLNHRLLHQHPTSLNTSISRCLTDPVQIQLTVRSMGEAAENDPSAWASATCVGVPEFPNSRHCCDSGPAMDNNWGVSQ